MNVSIPYSLFFRFWRRTVSALEMVSKMQPQRMRRRMKYKTHPEDREKGLVLFHNNFAKSLIMNFPRYTYHSKVFNILERSYKAHQG